MKLPAAHIEWRDDALHSGDYSDVYFSAAGALGETEHVFINGNALPARWRQSRHFAIGELGFGTGLNFLATLARWRASSSDDACLHYVAVERAPLTLEQARTVWQRFPSLRDEAEQLAAIYPQAIAGFHRRTLFGGRVSLTLVWGEVADTLPQIDGPIDAWYLDGFAPRCNADMWQHAVMQHVARCSREGTTIATYSVAASVRESLHAAGFVVEKRPGFGAKREMLTGVLRQYSVANEVAPWFRRPPPMAMSARERRAVVIGSGVAGVSVAFELAQRGWNVEVLEQSPQVAMGASGNPAAILTPLFSADMNAYARFNTSAFLYAVAWLHGLREVTAAWHANGVLEQWRLQAWKKIALCGIPDVLASVVTTGEFDVLPNSDALVRYALAGWVDARALCRDIVRARPEIVLRCGVQAESLRFADGRWQVVGARDVVASAPVVVLCTGAALSLRGVPELPLQPVRGQLTQFRVTDAPNVVMPLCGEGYAVPLTPDSWCAGAGYDTDNASAAPDAAETAANRRRLAELIGVSASNGIVESEHVGFRAVTPDRFPLVGALADPAWLREHYADLHHGRTYAHYPSIQYLPGLYVSTGFGSRGFTAAPYASQWIADLIDGTPLPGPRSWFELIAPMRFCVRALRKGAVA